MIKFSDNSVVRVSDKVENYTGKNALYGGDKENPGNFLISGLKIPKNSNSEKCVNSRIT